MLDKIKEIEKALAAGVITKAMAAELMTEMSEARDDRTSAPQRLEPGEKREPDWLTETVECPGWRGVQRGSPEECQIGDYFYAEKSYYNPPKDFYLMGGIGLRPSAFPVLFRMMGYTYGQSEPIGNKYGPGFFRVPNFRAIKAGFYYLRAR